MSKSKQLRLFPYGNRNLVAAKSHMYPNARTWNPAVGCSFSCIYCKYSFQAVVKRFWGDRCEYCKLYFPHEHPKRLFNIPCSKIIFVFGCGDIYFYNPSFVNMVLLQVMKHVKVHPQQVFYFQSKAPKCFERYLPLLEKIRDNVVLLTTLETNRDLHYEQFSKAPVPSIRFKDFLALDWPHKIVTIEPVMDFDLPILVKWIKALKPEAVYLGYNSRPSKVKLLEPSKELFWDLYDALSAFTEVCLKDTRGSRSKITGINGCESVG